MIIYFIIGELNALVVLLAMAYRPEVHRYNEARFGKSTARAAAIMTVMIALLGWPVFWVIVFLAARIKEPPV